MEASVQDGDVRSNAELAEASASGLRWVAYGRVGVEVLSLVAMVLLARLMPPAAFGVFAIVVIFQELALSMPMEGVGSALVQRRAVDQAHLEGGMALSLMLGGALALLSAAVGVFVVSPLYGATIGHLVVLASPCFLLGAMNVVPIATLRRRLDFPRLSVVDLSSNLTRSVVSIALALAGLDAPALVLGFVASMVTGLGMGWAFAEVPRPRWHRRAMRDLLGYGGPASLASIAWTGFRNGDYAVIGAKLGATQAGFYWRGYQLGVEYQRKISVVMTQMAFPVLARTAGAAEMHELRRRMVQLVTVLIFPMLAGLVILAPTVIPWLFGPSWEPAVVPTQILAAGGAVTLVIDAVGSALQATGRARAMLGYGIGHFVAYVGAVVLVARHGLAAVAVAAVLVHGAFLVVAYMLLLRGDAEHPLRCLWGDLAAAATSCAALAAVAAPLTWACARAGTPTAAELAVVIPVAAAAYGATLRLGFPAAWRDLLSALGRVARIPGLRTLVTARRARHAAA